MAKLGFLEALTNLSIDLNQYTLDDAAATIEEGRTLCSYVNSFDEYWQLECWLPLALIENYKKFMPLVKKGLFSFEKDPLGIILNRIDFKIDTIKSLVENTNPKCQDHYMKYIMETYGLDCDDPAWFAQLLPLGGILSVVDTWRKAQGRDKRWNPPYAKVQNVPAVFATAERTKPEEMLAHFAYDEDAVRNIMPLEDEIDHSYEPQPLQDSQLSLFGMDQVRSVAIPQGDPEYKARKVTGSYISLPFNGWTLAECLRLSYKNV